jgi:hypothetical protein
MTDLWKDFWIRESGTGQQVAQLHDRYMTMMMIMMMMMMMMMMMVMTILCFKWRFMFQQFDSIFVPKIYTFNMQVFHGNLDLFTRIQRHWEFEGKLSNLTENSVQRLDLCPVIFLSRSAAWGLYLSYQPEDRDISSLRNVVLPNKARR